MKNKQKKHSVRHLSKKIYFSSLAAIVLSLALLLQLSSFQQLVFLDAEASQPGTFTSSASTVDSGEEFTVTLTGVNFAASGTPNSFTLFARTEFNTDVAGISIAVDPSPIVTGTSTGFLTTALEEVAGFKIGKVRIENSADPDAFDLEAKFTVTNNEPGLKRMLIFGAQITPGGQVNTGSPYYVSVNSAAAVCGDASTDAPEVCDDGDATDAGTCNATCSALTSCGDGTTQNPNGNGGNETCDDGNTDDDDGCSSTCQSEASTNKRRRSSTVSVIQQDEDFVETSTSIDDIHGSARVCKDELLLKEDQEIPSVLDELSDGDSSSGYEEESGRIITENEEKRLEETIQKLMSRSYSRERMLSFLSDFSDSHFAGMSDEQIAERVDQFFESERLLQEQMEDNQNLDDIHPLDLLEIDKGGTNESASVEITFDDEEEDEDSLDELLDYFAETAEKEFQAHKLGPIVITPDYLDGFSYSVSYDLEDYAEIIDFSGVEDQDALLRESLSFVQRMTLGAGFDEKLENFLLPMWPAYNSATYGNVLAYLFPHEKDPLAFAFENELVEQEVAPEQYIRRLDFISLVDKTFLKNTEDPVDVLYKAGVLSKLDTWNDLDWELGFPLVEAVSVILDTVEIIEEKAFQSEKERYADNLIDLSDEGALEFSEDALIVALRAFAEEGDTSFDEEDYVQFTDDFDTSLGEAFNSKHLTEIKELYEEKSGVEPTIVFEPEAIQVIDDCTTDLSKKSSMPSVFKTGDLGFTFVCENIGISFPANAWVMNFSGLPDVEVVKTDEYSYSFDLKASLSYKNTLIIGESGEEALQLIYSTPGNDLYIDKSFEYFLADVDAGVLLDRVKAYEDLNGEIFGRLFLHPRKFSGDMIFSFDTLF